MNHVTKAPTYATTRAEAEAKLAEFNARCDKRGVPQAERDRWLAEARLTKQRGGVPPVPVWATKPYGSLPTSPSLLLPPEGSAPSEKDRQEIQDMIELQRLMAQYTNTSSP